MNKNLIIKKEIMELDKISNNINKIHSEKIQNILYFLLSVIYEQLDKNINNPDNSDNKKIIKETKSFGGIKYVEIIRFLKYLVNHVTNSTTKTVINELIKVLTKLEFTSVSLVPITSPRYKASRDVVRYVGGKPYR